MNAYGLTITGNLHHQHNTTQWDVVTKTALFGVTNIVHFNSDNFGL